MVADGVVQLCWVESRATKRQTSPTFTLMNGQLRAFGSGRKPGYAERCSKLGLVEDVNARVVNVGNVK